MKNIILSLFLFSTVLYGMQDIPNPGRESLKCTMIFIECEIAHDKFNEVYHGTGDLSEAFYAQNLGLAQVAGKYNIPVTELSRIYDLGKILGLERYMKYEKGRVKWQIEKISKNKKAVMQEIKNRIHNNEELSEK
jgi:hypothetical protein